eukprot:2860288-Rhodomonas_salina.5
MAIVRAVPQGNLVGSMLLSFMIFFRRSDACTDSAISLQMPLTTRAPAVCRVQGLCKQGAGRVAACLSLRHLRLRALGAPSGPLLCLNAHSVLTVISQAAVGQWNLECNVY